MCEVALQGEGRDIHSYYDTAYKITHFPQLTISCHWYVTITVVKFECLYQKMQKHTTHAHTYIRTSARQLTMLLQSASDTKGKRMTAKWRCKGRHNHWYMYSNCRNTLSRVECTTNIYKETLDSQMQATESSVALILSTTKRSLCSILQTIYCISRESSPIGLVNAVYVDANFESRVLLDRGIVTIFCVLPSTGKEEEVLNAAPLIQS